MPNVRYGFGRLSAAGALGVQATGQLPTLTLTATPANPTIGEQVTLTPSMIDPSGDPSPELKWDDGYDGSWDVAYAPLAPRVVSSATVGRFAYKARARNHAGLFAEAVIWLAYGEAIPPSKSGCGCRQAAGMDVAVACLVGCVALLVRRRWRL